MAVSRTPVPPDYGSAAPAVDRATGASPSPPAAIPFTDRALWVRVIRHARCTSSSLDPDQWFPVSAEIDKARREAAAAITVCTTCLVRAECLVLSLRHWDIGQHGVWGGLVAAERAALPRRRHAAVLSPSRGTSLADRANPDVERITRQRAGAEMVGGARDHAATVAVPKP
jgi:Transcription factor WhiB